MYYKKNIQISIVVLFLSISIFAQIQVSKNALDDTSRVKTLIKKARLFTSKGSDSSLYYASLAKTISLKIGFIKGVAGSYLETGEYYNSKGYYDLSLKNFSEAYRLFDSIGNKYGMSNAMNTIGNVYMGLGNSSKALNSFEKSYEIARNDSNKYMMCISLFGIANIKETEKKYNDALKCYQKTLHYIETVPRCNSFSTVYYINTSSILNVLNKPQQAINNLYKALATLNSTENLYALGETYRMMAESYGNLNNDDSTTYYFAKSEAILLQKASLDNIQNLYFDIFNFYMKNKKHEKALFFYMKHIQYKDSVFNINKSQQILEIEKRIENEKIKKEITVVSNKFDETQQLLEQKKHENKIIYFSIIGLVFLLGLIGYLWFKNKQANHILKQKNKEKDALVQEIHHRVKNNLQFVSSLINMQINASHNETEIYSLNDTSRRIRSMALVHEMLYNQDEVKGISISQYITELTESINDLINSQNLPIRFDVQIPNVYIGISQATALGMITSELISNAIKYAFNGIESPTIEIKMRQHVSDHTFIYLVKDNGCGLMQTTEIKNKLGMRLINIFSRQLKGEYTMINNNGLQYEIIFKA